MSIDATLERALDPFVDEGLITRPISRLSSGKEATVWCCEAGRAAGGRDLVAAKVYREADRRAFRGHMHYFKGRHVAGRAARKAIETRNRAGRRILFEHWIAFEYEALATLHAAGVDVPRPLSLSSNCVVMEYVGNRHGPAPQLHQIRLGTAEVRDVMDRLLDDVERMLARDLIHGDLSAYNVLWWNDGPVIIDVPQALDPRVHPDAYGVLARDVQRLADWAGSCGVRFDAARYTNGLWRRWMHAEL